MYWMEKELEFMADASLERSLRTSGSVSGSPGYTLRGEQVLLNMSSNDYLGLSQHPAILEVMREALLTEGAGSRRFTPCDRKPDVL